jgi:hypothetical protein
MSNKAIAYVNTLHNLIDTIVSDLIDTEMLQYEEDIDYDKVDSMIRLLDATDNYMKKIKESL